MKLSAFVVAILGCLVLTATAVRVRQEQSKSEEGSQRDMSALISQLMTAATQVQRVELLEDKDFVFDFVNPPTLKTTAAGKGGKSVTAHRGVFPALIGAGIGMTIGFIEPCGMNTPHTHPRATELFFSVNGTFQTGFIQENGAREVKNTVEPGQATVFPMGSIHWQANLGCESVMFVAGLSNEDPGTSQIAQNFFKIDEEILSATLGGESDKEIKEIKGKIPANIALGLKTCQERCFKKE